MKFLEYFKKDKSHPDIDHYAKADTERELMKYEIHQRKKLAIVCFTGSMLLDTLYDYRNINNYL